MIFAFSKRGEFFVGLCFEKEASTRSGKALYLFENKQLEVKNWGGWEDDLPFHVGVIFRSYGCFFGGVKYWSIFKEKKKVSKTL